MRHENADQETDIEELILPMRERRDRNGGRLVAGADAGEKLRF
jgi:hypothetical protein